jgi:hypothetical protein
MSIGDNDDGVTETLALFVAFVVSELEAVAPGARRRAADLFAQAADKANSPSGRSLQRALGEALKRHQPDLRIVWPPKDRPN